MKLVAHLHLSKKQFIMNHFFMPKTHSKPPVSNTPFVGYQLAYNKHMRFASTTTAQNQEEQQQQQEQEQSQQPTSLSLPSSSANPFACFMNVVVAPPPPVSTTRANDANDANDAKETGGTGTGGTGFAAPQHTMAFDGCSKGNPGRAGAGAVIYHNEVEIWADSKFVGTKETNNVAEYSGLIMGLHEALRRNITHLTVLGDSELIIKQMNKQYAVKSANIKAYHDMAASLAKQFASIQFKHVYRNHNTRADELSNLGLELALKNDNNNNGT
jgi:ribonuclease HI